MMDGVEVNASWTQNNDWVEAWDAEEDESGNNSDTNPPVQGQLQPRGPPCSVPNGQQTHTTEDRSRIEELLESALADIQMLRARVVSLEEEIHHREMREHTNKEIIATLRSQVQMLTRDLEEFEHQGFKSMQTTKEDNENDEQETEISECGECDKGDTDCTERAGDQEFEAKDNDSEWDLSPDEDGWEERELWRGDAFTTEEAHEKEDERQPWGDDSEAQEAGEIGFVGEDAVQSTADQGTNVNNDEREGYGEAGGTSKGRWLVFQQTTAFEDRITTMELALETTEAELCQLRGERPTEIKEIDNGRVDLDVRTHLQDSRACIREMRNRSGRNERGCTEREIDEAGPTSPNAEKKRRRWWRIGLRGALGGGLVAAASLAVRALQK